MKDRLWNSKACQALFFRDVNGWFFNHEHSYTSLGAYKILLSAASWERMKWGKKEKTFLVCLWIHLPCLHKLYSFFFFNFRKLNKSKLEKGGAGDCGHESLMKCGFLRAIGEKTSRIFKWKIQLPSHTIGRAGSIFLGIWRCSTHTRLPIILWSCNCQILL